MIGSNSRSKCLNRPTPSLRCLWTTDDLVLEIIPHLQEVICNKQAEDSKALKSSCEADLAEALPALESAVSALKSLSKGDIVEVSTKGIIPSMGYWLYSRVLRVAHVFKVKYVMVRYCEDMRISTMVMPPTRIAVPRSRQ